MSKECYDFKDVMKLFTHFSLNLPEGPCDMLKCLGISVLVITFCAPTTLAQRAVIKDKRDREVEQNLLNKPTAQAIVSYRQLMRKHPQLESQMMNNLLFMHRRVYENTRSYNNYQRLLDQNIRASKYQANSHAHFQRLIQAENKKIKSGREVAAFVRLVRAYMVHSDNKQGYDEMIGRAYVRFALHKEASAHYEQLSRNADYKREDVYLALAILHREKQYKQPHEPDWSRKSRRSSQRDLYELYERELTLRQGHWQTRAKYGLQLVGQGAIREAFENWRSNLTQQSPYARRAAGFMIIFFHEAKDWENLEIFIKEIDAKSIRADGLTRPQRDYLADALYELGYAAFVNQDYVTAKAKLTELVRDHKLHLERALFYLSQAQWRTAESEAAVATMVRLIETFPKSNFSQQAIRMIADWSVQMADEEMALKYFKMYVDRFNMNDVYEPYLALLHGRELYFEANDLLRRAIRTGNLAAIQRLLINSFYFGSEEESRRDIAFVEKTAGGPSDLTHYFSARLAFQAKNDRDIRARMNRIVQTPHYRQELMLLLAVRETTGLKDDIFSLAVKDPQAELEKQIVAFQSIQRNFDEVCALATNSFCALSRLELANACVRQIERISALSISSAFDESITSAFQSRKDSYVKSLAALRDKSRASSLEPLGSSRSLPLTTDAVLWANSKDWNFDRITGEIRRGYVQKEVKQ
jgi:hypothetical protein